MIIGYLAGFIGGFGAGKNSVLEREPYAKRPPPIVNLRPGHIAQPEERKN